MNLLWKLGVEVFLLLVSFALSFAIAQDIEFVLHQLVN
jgi:hypothetical protein